VGGRARIRTMAGYHESISLSWVAYGVGELAALAQVLITLGSP